VFDGDNPHMWQTLAEQYFAMFSIYELHWVPMAILNFTGSPKIWLHSAHKKIAGFTCESFCTLLSTRFGRDKHQLLIFQFFSLKQLDSVADYIGRFETLMNNHMAYSDTIHPSYFITRFIERLRSDIRVVVMLQRPPDLDSACGLALLQEEVVDIVRPSSTRFGDFTARAIPLPLPPPPAARGEIPATDVDKRGHEARNPFSDSAAKLSALKAYRRAKGLCFKCVESWGKEHTCPASIQLHIVEELWEFLGTDALGVEDDATSLFEAKETV
jgi:hypothetical protein